MILGLGLLPFSYQFGNSFYSRTNPRNSLKILHPKHRGCVFLLNERSRCCNEILPWVCNTKSWISGSIPLRSRTRPCKAPQWPRGALCAVALSSCSSNSRPVDTAWSSTLTTSQSGNATILGVPGPFRCRAAWLERNKRYRPCRHRTSDIGVVA